MCGACPPPRSGLAKAIATVFALPFHIYRRIISPLTPPSCRFLPTCSAYAVEALEKHGPWRGAWLTLRRVARCHPFETLGAGSGYDPVPDPDPEREKKG